MRHGPAGARGVEHAIRRRARRQADQHAARVGARRPRRRRRRRASGRRRRASTFTRTCSASSRPRSRSSSTPPHATSRPRSMIATSRHRRSTRSSWWLREDHRHARLGPLGEHAAHHVDADRIEPGERLVEDQQLGVVHEGDAELDALLVAERERLHLVAGPLGSAQPLDPALGRRRGRRAGEPVQAREVDELVAHAHRRVEPALLGHVAEAAAHRGVDRARRASGRCPRRARGRRG